MQANHAHATYSKEMIVQDYKNYEYKKGRIEICENNTCIQNVF